MTTIATNGITVTAGVPTAGTGTVSPIDSLMADGGQATIGSKADAAVSNPSSSASVVAALKGLLTLLAGTLTVATHAVTQSGNWAMRLVGNSGAIMDFAGQNATAPANSLLVGAEFNTTPSTITSGNASPLQVDAAGNLLVNIKAGAGSGGTAIADEATFTEGTTSLTPIGGVFKTSQTALTNGQAGAVALTAAREMMGLHKTWDGTNTAAVKAASTAPVATDPALVVAISPNSVNSNGRKTPANSAPVTLNSYTYQAVAASASATALTGGGGGALGDYLATVLIIPGTAAAGAVSITDGSGSAIPIFAGGGTTALPTLAPIPVPIDAISSSGAWKITTGTNVTVIATGNFT